MRKMLVMIVCMIILLFVGLMSVTAELEGGKYQREVAINSGTSLRDYQVLIELNSTNFNFSKTTRNGSDIKFTDSNEKELNYWIEEFDAVNETGKIWVKVPYINSTRDPTTIKMYYGNSSASTASDGINTFLFFDDFQIEGHGYFDVNTWWATGRDISVSSSQLLTIPTGAVYTKNTVDTTNTGPFILEAKVKWNNFDGNGSGLHIANANSTSVGNKGNNKLVYAGIMTEDKGEKLLAARAPVGTVYKTDFTAEKDTPYILGYAVTPSIKFYIDRNEINSRFRGGYLSGSFYLWLGYFAGSASGSQDIADIVVDWVLVRKYASQEPTVEVGEETLIITRPSEPQNLNATPGDRNVTLRWDAPCDNGGVAIENYRIYRITPEEESLKTIGNVLTYTDWDVAYDKKYNYQVSAVNSAGEGLKSNETCVTLNASKPSKPQDLRADVEGRNINLKWSAPSNRGSSAIKYYKIYRSIKDIPEEWVRTIGNVTNYTDRDVVYDKIYNYKVSAVNSAGEGPGSKLKASQEKVGFLSLIKDFLSRILNERVIALLGAAAAIVAICVAVIKLFKYFASRKTK